MIWYEKIFWVEEKKCMSIGIQCNILLPCTKQHVLSPKKSGSDESTPDLSPKTPEYLGKKRESFFTSDDTLDSESDAQNIVKFQGPVRKRRRLRFKTQHPESYKSDDDDSQFRSGILQAEWKPAVSASQLGIELTSNGARERQNNASPEIF